MVKIEEGLAGGTVLYHKYQTKTEEEKAALDEKKATSLEQKEDRRRVQNENIIKKEKAKEDQKKNQQRVRTNILKFLKTYQNLTELGKSKYQNQSVKTPPKHDYVNVKY